MVIFLILAVLVALILIVASWLGGQQGSKEEQQRQRQAQQRANEKIGHVAEKSATRGRTNPGNLLEAALEFITDLVN